VVGVTRPDAAPLSKARLQQFLAEGAHGDMIWMETSAERRGDPRTLWPEVRSVIMLGLNYGPDHDPLAILEAPRTRRDLGLRQGRGLSRHHQAQAERRGALADRAGPAAT
jgi:epoxyqueuosine reductase